MKIVFQHISGQEIFYSVENLKEANELLHNIVKAYPISYVSFYREGHGDFVMLLPEFIKNCIIFVKPDTAEDSEEIKNS